MNQIYESLLWNMSFCTERADFNPKLGVREEAKKLWELLCSFFFIFKQAFIMPLAAAGGQQPGSLACTPSWGEVCPGVTGGVA